MFRWLHFSDLHVGVATQAWLWPRFKTNLLEDLSRLFDGSGPWDAVLFTGDLTQKADGAEFDSLDRVLDEIWSHFERLGTQPTLVTIPGNHDLVRPPVIDTVALNAYWTSDVLRKALLDGKAPREMNVIETAFAPYCAWRNRQVKAGRHAAPVADGLFPGDAAYRLQAGERSIGVAGLNSAWLQLGPNDFQGLLGVDVRQLLAITGEDPDGWCADNVANLLLTHHPVDWLHKDNLDQWHNDIDSPGRFDLHLYGHMHEHDLTSTARGGGAARHAAQASALFGLEYLGDNKSVRIQGYSINSLSDHGDERLLRVWPRILTRQRDRSLKLAADTAMGLDDDKSFTHSYRRGAAGETVDKTPPASLTTPSVVSLERSPADVATELEKIRYFISDAPAHRNVRRIEFSQMVAALEAERIAWIVADWGMGEDGFVATVQAHFEETGAHTYRFDLSEYQTRDQFLSEAKARFGATFETLCENISTVGASYILLDDIPVDRPEEPGTLSIERDIETLAGIITEFSSRTKVLLRTQRTPRGDRELPVIEIKALDEADVAIYLRDSRSADDGLTKPDIVGGIYRLTDGVPNRLDSALRELEVASLDDLLTTNSDLGHSAVTVAAPKALVTAIAEIETSDDSSERFSYDLLKALAALPRGEQLSKIARLHGPRPFRPSHALALTSRALVDSTILSGIEAGSESATTKALVAPRPVREFVRSRLTDDEARSLDRQMLELYFGEGWKSGEITSSLAGRRARDSLCETYEIVNASTLIVRLLRRAVDDGNGDELEAAIRLSSAFIECLATGSHHRGAVALCDDVIPLVPAEGRQRQITILEFERAANMRMIGKLVEARDALEKLDYSQLTKEQKQSAKLDLALAFHRLGDAPNATRVARECIVIDRKANLAVQAEAIIAEQLADPDARMARLKSLRTRSERAKSPISTNNIGITLANEATRRGDTDEAVRLLREVIDCAQRERDFYNGARAIARLAPLHPRGARFDAVDKMRLIDAYHFSHNERLPILFDQCHGALWNVFEDEGDIPNLLSLFRHSSFIWRINGRDAAETAYLERLRGLQSEMQKPSRDREYFFVRIVLILGKIADDDPRPALPG